MIVLINVFYKILNDQTELKQKKLKPELRKSKSRMYRIKSAFQL